MGTSWDETVNMLILLVECLEGGFFNSPTSSSDNFELLVLFAHGKNIKSWMKHGCTGTIFLQNLFERWIPGRDFDSK